MFKQGLVLRLLAVSALFALTAAQEQWSWSKKAETNPNAFNVRSDLIALQGSTSTASDRKRNTVTDRRGRYEVKEGTTKRPAFGRPQNDEFSGEFGEGSQPNDFGLNQKFGGGGFANGQFRPNQYGINPGFGGGGLPFQGGLPYGPGGQLFGGGAGGYGGASGYGGAGGYGGGLGYGAGGNGILVGPGGPTGIIGRPYNRFPQGGGAGFPYGNGFGNAGFGGQPGGYFPGAGGYPYQPGGFYQQPFGGPGGVGPGLSPFGGGPQFGPQFDQPRQANKKEEKRSSL